MSTVAAQRGPRFRVLGDRGAFVKHGMDPQEEALRRGGSPVEARWGEEPETLWGMLGMDGKTRRVRTRPGGYGSFYSALAESLRAGAPPPVDPEDAVSVLELLEAARTG
jgi:predicted dehydrogenase